MKRTLLALVLLISPMWAMAQKHNIFTDVSVALNYGEPGLSATYNYKFANHFAAGIGWQGYNYPNAAGSRQFISAMFADVRSYFPSRKHMFFIFFDPGIDFYKGVDYFYVKSRHIYELPHTNCFYSGLGGGYFRRMTKRGGGAYVSLKFPMDVYKKREYNIAKKVFYDATLLNGTLAISVGFKF